MGLRKICSKGYRQLWEVLRLPSRDVRKIVSSWPRKQWAMVKKLRRQTSSSLTRFACLAARYSSVEGRGTFNLTTRKSELSCKKRGQRRARKGCVHKYDPASRPHAPATPQIHFFKKSDMATSTLRQLRNDRRRRKAGRRQGCPRDQYH